MTTRLLRSLAPVAMFVLPAVARADTVSLDPPGSNAILAGVSWLQGTLLGNVATAVAVIAIAAVGFMMLTGRLNWRYGATVIMGCFVLFGASAIVGGIKSASGMG